VVFLLHSALTTHTVHLIQEHNDRPAALLPGVAGMAEEVTDKLLTLPHPAGENVSTGHRIEDGLALSSNSWIVYQYRDTYIQGHHRRNYRGMCILP
jgi:hypothetical protein